jgi:hypothetical protein
MVFFKMASSPKESPVNDKEQSYRQKMIEMDNKIAIKSTVRDECKVKTSVFHNTLAHQIEASHQPDDRSFKIILDPFSILNTMWVNG